MKLLYVFEEDSELNWEDIIGVGASVALEGEFADELEGDAFLTLVEDNCRLLHGLLRGFLHCLLHELQFDYSLPGAGGISHLAALPES